MRRAAAACAWLALPACVAQECVQLYNCGILFGMGYTCSSTVPNVVRLSLRSQHTSF